ncbi:hypothetical protein ABPG74_004493 [Tetrahymena malaccensis]
MIIVPTYFDFFKLSQIVENRLIKFIGRVLNKFSRREQMFRQTKIQFCKLDQDIFQTSSKSIFIIFLVNFVQYYKRECLQQINKSIKAKYLLFLFKIYTIKKFIASAAKCGFLIIQLIFGRKVEDLSKYQIKQKTTNYIGIFFYSQAENEFLLSKNRLKKYQNLITLLTKSAKQLQDIFL